MKTLYNTVSLGFWEGGVCLEVFGILRRSAETSFLRERRNQQQKQTPELCNAAIRNIRPTSTQVFFALTVYRGRNSSRHLKVIIGKINCFVSSMVLLHCLYQFNNTPVWNMNLYLGFMVNNITMRVVGVQELFVGLFSFFVGKTVKGLQPCHSEECTEISPMNLPFSYTFVFQENLQES